ncbi:MAG: enoyl-CoA hydratase/isomerase family protein [Bythopirellula sp.]|nr:enoyl-CoA hydratase/isomerase family protein [Bythopirellula sp.]
MYMQSALVEVKVIDNVGTVILNRPDHGNALVRIMVHQLTEAFDDLYREKRVRAIILTGAGEAFCSGTDLEEINDTSQQKVEWAESEDRWGEDAADYRDLLLRMLEITKPIIAAVNGPALSAGAGLVMASDIVVASHAGSFGLPDPRRGLVAGVVAPLVCHRLGAGQAARLLLSSTTIDAQEAARLGIFHELVEPDKVWARAVELARECAEGAPQALQLTKRLLNETMGEQLETQLTAGAVMQATAFTTEAAQEGIAAFLAQRKPEWK